MPVPLLGRHVGITADRKREIQRRLLEARGAAVVEGPTMQTRYLPDDPTLRAVTEMLAAEPPDVFVADTGVGISAWFEAAESWGLQNRLAEAVQASEPFARGAKAASALRRLTGVAATTAPGGRIDGLRQPLAGRALAGCRVAVQRSGADDEPFLDWLRSEGAEVVPVEVYRWELPSDPAPAHGLVHAACEGRLDAVTFTSAPGARNLFILADQLDRAGDLRAAFAGGLVGACVGPVCADAARQAGVAHPVFNESGRLVDMIEVLVDALRAPT